MQKLSISLVVLALAGCTTTDANVDAPSLPNLTVYHVNTINPELGNTTALQPIDIKAINEEIAATNRVDWAPQDEVLQQRMDTDF